MAKKKRKRKPKPRVLTADGRYCGRCTACCYALGVEGLKGDFRRCENQRRRGCAIYDERPQACRDYRCLWLMDMLPELSDRPDRIGAVFTASSSPFFGEYFQVAEIKEGAIYTVRVRQIIDVLGQHGAVLHMAKHTRSMLAGPEEIREKLVKALMVNQPLALLKNPVTALRAMDRRK